MVPSTPTIIGVCPAPASDAASSDAPSICADGRAYCSISARLPTRTVRPSTRVTMPLPVTGVVSSGRPTGGTPASSAASMMARARGCSEPASAAAAQRRTVFLSLPGSRTMTSVSSGRPSVSVPVLSTATVEIFAEVSRYSPPLMRMPLRAARPIPATMATGMEMTSAPGQPMTSRVRARTMSRETRPAMTASRMTPGVYHREKRSMKAWVLALASCASSTRWMMRARVVSDPVPVASTCRNPPRETVPAKTRSPVVLSTGIDSPVIEASSTAPAPDRTRPSTGTFAPLLTRTVSPTRTFPAGMTSCSPSRSTTAVSGATAISSASAERVRLRVAASIAWPTAKRKVTAAASQKLPVATAPRAATDTSRSIPMSRAVRPRTALTTIGVPATTAAASMARSPRPKTPPSWVAWAPASSHHCELTVMSSAPSAIQRSAKAMTISAPDRTGTAQFPLDHARIRVTVFVVCGVCAVRAVFMAVQRPFRGVRPVRTPRGRRCSRPWRRRRPGRPP